MINWGLGDLFFFRKFSKNAWFSRVCSISVPWLSRSTGKLYKIMGYVPLLRLSTGGYTMCL